MNTVLIFDYDGVIVDSFDIFSKLFIQACKDNQWNEISSKHEFLSLFNGNMYENMMALGMSKQDILQVVTKVKENLLENLQNIPLFPNIKQTLTILAQHHILCISTSNDSHLVETYLDINKIFCIKNIYGSDIHHSKTKKIQLIQQQYPRKQYIYIGDTQGDIIEGKKANIFTIGVTWGWHTKQQLLKAHPDYLVESIQDLKTIANTFI